MQSEDLVRAYKRKMPPFAPKWDATPNSIDFNDVSEKDKLSGLSIYSCTMDELWAGLYDPWIYDANTLWNESLHDSDKIARVISAWSKDLALSPLVLVRHGALDKGLVADGKHRLTVARFAAAKQVPFMVATRRAEWVSRAFPSAVCMSASA